MSGHTIYVAAAVMLIAAGCSQSDLEYEFPGGCGPVYPDYMDVTVPGTIAPLNFCYTSPSSDKVSTTFAAGDCSFTVKGRKVSIPEAEWRRLLSASDTVRVTSSEGYGWNIYVSEDEIDYGLNYRKLAPGYEVYSKMGIYERELSTFSEKALLENTEFDGCVNCHAYNRGAPDDMSLHIRGDHGATIIRRNGHMEAFNTKTDSTLGFCVYPYWHPSGEYIAYSTNNTRQGFHVQQDKMIEVFDLASDLQVYDLQNNQVVTRPELKVDDVWETFPAFSPDGGTLYFCEASAKEIPADVTGIRYNLCKVSFNPSTGAIGSKIDTLIFAEGEGASISFPKPSFDGRWLMYTRSGYGNFSIWHHEADLWVLDLTTGESRPLDSVNSEDTESYHNWSSNSRWFVFSSRRDNGLYTRLYICHFSEDGTAAKPFMLPQKDPADYYNNLMLSYNVPEFVTGPVHFDHKKARKMIMSSERSDFGFRWSD